LFCEAKYVPGEKTFLRETAREGGREREGEGKGGERESERREEEEGLFKAKTRTRGVRAEKMEHSSDW
jgi:hypothetical protein